MSSSFIVHRFPSLVVVLEVAAVAALRFHVEDDAGVDGAGVDVHADGALVPLGEVADAMDGLQLVDGVERAAWDGELVVEMLHVDLRRAGETVEADDLLIFGTVAVDLAVVLD